MTEKEETDAKQAPKKNLNQGHRSRMRKRYLTCGTDYETMLEIFKRSGVKITCMQDDYIEIEPETYGENVGFDFDSQGNFKKLL